MTLSTAVLRTGGGEIKAKRNGSKRRVLFILLYLVCFCLVLNMVMVFISLRGELCLLHV